MLNLKQGDKIICTKAYHPFINGGIYEVSSTSGEYFMCNFDGWGFLGFLSGDTINIAVGDVLNTFDVYTSGGYSKSNLGYSELIELMLSDGCTHIMCELTNTKGGFTLGEGLHDIGVVNWVERSPSIYGWLFETVDGNFYDEARAINLDGSVMTYQDYLKTKNTEV